MTQDIKRQAVRSVAVTLGAQAVKFALGLVVTMILARLLTPKDYGVVAMVSVITAFVGVFRDGGLSIATVQRAEISDAQLSTLFWINAALGGASAMLLAILSPLVGWLYDDQALVLMVVALAVPFLLGGFTVQLQALLQRQMRFKAIAFIEITTLIVSAAIGILAAAAGWGSWALVTMAIAVAVVNAGQVFLFCRWRPSRPVRGAGVRSMLKFGGELTASRLFDSLACSTDALLLGKMYGPDVLGLYSRAQTLMLQPLAQLMPPLVTVALPVMSRLAETPATLRRVFLDLLQLTAFASSFIAVVIVVGSDWIVGVFLGPRWKEASDILRLLAGPALFLPISTLCLVGITARGEGSTLMRWSLQRNAITLFAIVAGAAWGAKGVAASLSIASVFVLMPFLSSITAKAGLALQSDIWTAIGPGIGVCVVGCGMLYPIKVQLARTSPLTTLFELVVLSGALHLAIMAALPSSRMAIARILRAVPSFRVRREE